MYSFIIWLLKLNENLIRNVLCQQISSNYIHDEMQVTWTRPRVGTPGSPFHQLVPNYISWFDQILQSIHCHHHLSPMIRLCQIVGGDQQIVLLGHRKPLCQTDVGSDEVGVLQAAKFHLQYRHQPPNLYHSKVIDSIAIT